MKVFDVIYEFWHSLFDYTVTVSNSTVLDSMLEQISIVMTIVSIFFILFAFIKIIRKLVKL